MQCFGRSDDLHKLLEAYQMGSQKYASNLSPAANNFKQSHLKVGLRIYWILRLPSKGVHCTKTESVRCDLALSSMFDSVAYVEHIWHSWGEGFIVYAAKPKSVVNLRNAEDVHSLLQKPITVRIYSVQALWLRDGHMIVSYTNYRPILLMSPMHPSEFLASSCTECQPYIAEPC